MGGLVDVRKGALGDVAFVSTFMLVWLKTAFDYRHPLPVGLLD